MRGRLWDTQCASGADATGAGAGAGAASPGAVKDFLVDPHMLHARWRASLLSVHTLQSHSADALPMAVGGAMVDSGGPTGALCI